MIVTLSEAKEYLRIDIADEDTTVENLLKSAQNLCMDVARIDSETEFDAAGDISKTAVLYALGYFYEHRGDNTDTDLHALTLTLRSLLFGIRQGVL